MGSIPSPILTAQNSPHCSHEVASQEALVDGLGGDCARPKNTAFLDFYFYVPDVKHNKLSSIQRVGVCCPLWVTCWLLFNCQNVMEKYGTPIFGVDKYTGNLCTIEANKMVYRQIKGESRTCQEIDFGNMTEQLQTDNLDKYEGFQAEIH